MEKDMSAIPMVISMKENTSLVDDMGGVYTPGILEQSTMESLKQISDTERYDFVPFKVYILFSVLSKKKDNEAPGKKTLFANGVSPALFHLFSLDFSLSGSLQVAQWCHLRWEICQWRTRGQRHIHL
jgi:hypothetical protein